MRVLAVIALLAASAVAQEFTVTDLGTQVTRDEASQITVTGPEVVETNTVVSCRIGGTPEVDLSKPLVDQMEWLTGERRMTVWLAIPGQPLQRVPEITATVVFGSQGATLRPTFELPVGGPGEYRAIVDWNLDIHQVAEYRVVVDGDKDDGDEEEDDDSPNPPVPPVSDLLVTLLTEVDDQGKGLGGAALANHIEEVRAYLKPLPCKWRILDDDQPGSSVFQELLDQSSLRLPAIVVSAISTNTVVNKAEFGENGAATIEILKSMGVK